MPIRQFILRHSPTHTRPASQPRASLLCCHRIFRNRGGYHMRRLLSLIVMASLMTLCHTARAGDNDSRPLPYQLGHGLQFPQYGLGIGGYVSLLYSGLADQDWRITNRDLSLFITKTFAARWSIFSGVEIGDALNVSGSDVSSEDAELDLERLYADYRATPEITLRFGKFLTPVGHWNQIHTKGSAWIW